MAHRGQLPTQAMLGPRSPGGRAAYDAPGSPYNNPAMNIDAGYGSQHGGYPPQAGYPPQGGYYGQPGPYQSGPYGSRPGSSPGSPTNKHEVPNLPRKFTIEFLFFGAACSVIAAGVISACGTATTTFAPFDLIDSIYLLLFGLVVLVQDFPVRAKIIMELQAFNARYCQFLSRLTGRALWYVFLGTLTFASLWNNPVWPLGGFVLGSAIFVIGLYGTILGITKTRVLYMIRSKIIQNREQLATLYTAFARTAPEEGLTYEEFNNMCAQVAGLQFKPSDAGLVYGALSGSAAGAKKFITLRDLNDWILGTMTIV